jgi:hypothetical protein
LRRFSVPLMFLVMSLLILREPRLRAGDELF